MGLNLKSISGASKSIASVAKQGFSGELGSVVGKNVMLEMTESGLSEKTSNITGKVFEKATNALVGATAGAAGGAIVGGGIAAFNDDMSIGEGIAQGARGGAAGGAIAGALFIGGKPPIPPFGRAVGGGGPNTPPPGGGAVLGGNPPDTPPGGGAVLGGNPPDTPPGGGISKLTALKDRAMARGVATFQVGQQKIGEAVENVTSSVGRRYTTL